MKPEDKAKLAQGLAWTSLLCACFTAVPALVVANSAMKALPKDSEPYKRARLALIVSFIVCGAWFALAAVLAAIAPPGGYPHEPSSPRPKAAPVEDIGPEPVASGWDGSVQIVQDYLSRTMKDFDSLKILDTSPVKKTNRGGVEYWGVRYRWKGKNSFGAYEAPRNDLFLIRNGKVVQVVPMSN